MISKDQCFAKLTASRSRTAILASTACSTLRVKMIILGKMVALARRRKPRLDLQISLGLLDKVPPNNRLLTIFKFNLRRPIIKAEHQN